MARLRKKEVERLEGVLAGLPEGLGFLRAGILAVAGQDLELVGSGEMDTEVLEAGLLERAREEGGTVDAGRLGERLLEWVKGVAKETDGWAGPVWVAGGFLAGGGEVERGRFVEPAGAAGGDGVEEGDGGCASGDEGEHVCGGDGDEQSGGSDFL